MRATFDLAPTRGAETLRVLAHMLEGLTRVNVDQIEGGGVPPLYLAGVRYKSEVTRRVGRPALVTEDWRDARTVLRHRAGDCEDLSSYLAAQRRVEGYDAIALPFYVRPGLIHCVVYAPACPSGPIEDPSVRLGLPDVGAFDAQILEALGVILP